MTELLIADSAPSRVLEIGCGSGYQSAVLAGLVAEVYGLERIKPLLVAARRRLRQLKLRNVHLRHGDGFGGWASQAPFDGILCAAAPEQLPEELLAQLAPGGRLVIPVGKERQHLVVVEHGDDGFTERRVEAVRFVPMVRGLGVS